jgi:hypothetical protein
VNQANKIENVVQYIGDVGAFLMDRSTFETRLRMAAQEAVRFARQFVRKVLPDDVVFLVYPNQSYDGNPRVVDEEVFPEESLPYGQYYGPLSATLVMDFLWRDWKVPEWIDTAVCDEDGRRTTVSLHCCGRFTAQDGLLYYPNRDTRPFAVKSPDLPPGWEGVDVSGKFSLHRSRVGGKSYYGGRGKSTPAP